MRNIGRKNKLADAARMVVTMVLASACKDGAAPNVPTASGSARAESDSGEVGIDANPWTSLPFISFPRQGMAAVQLNSCVWLLGGWRGVGTAQAEVQKFCPASPGAWTAAPSLPQERYRFAGARVINGRIYAVGGLDATEHARNTLYIYSPTTSTWTLSSEPLPFSFACGDASVVGGKLYVYARRPVPDAVIPDPVRCQKGFAGVFAVYNSAKASPPRWTILSPPPSDRCDPTLETLNSKVHVLSGHDCSHNTDGSVDVYDPAIGTWLPPSMTPPQMPYPRFGVAAAVLNSRMFVFGGHDGSIPFTPGREVSVYDPAIGTWAELRPMQIERMNAAAVTSTSTAIAVIGGSRDWAWLGGGEHASVEQIKFSGCDIHEPDNSVTKANPVRWVDEATGEPLWNVSMSHARICTASDVDLYSFSTSRWYRGNLQLLMTSPVSMDYQLELLDATGTTVLARSALPGNATESINWVVTFGQDYIVRVRSQNGSFDASRPYVLNSYQ